MAYAVSYKLVNDTGGQLTLVGTDQYPSPWLPPAPGSIAPGGQALISTGMPSGEVGVAIVFGYSSAGSSLTQFWVLGTVDVLGPHTAPLAPSGHSITVGTEGNSEDGFLVTLTYQ